jgi:hypothetical protein
VAFPGLLEELVVEGFEIDVMEMIRRWSVERFMAFGCGRVRVDWMQPVIPLYARVLDSAEEKPWLDATLRVATAEGLILTKMVSFRPQDQVDEAACRSSRRRPEGRGFAPGSCDKPPQEK